MSSKPTPAELLACVQRSPAAVAIHDREAWVGLYAKDGEINDPVGSRPHVGRRAIEKFYDTFIAPNTIVFHVQKDIVCGMTAMRDLDIETTMSTGVKLTVPMHLNYEIVNEEGQLKIHRLFARWELAFMIGQLLGTGFIGFWTAMKLGLQLITNQGIGGMIGFMKGFLGVGRAGKRVATRFADALKRGDTAAAKEQLAVGATLDMPAGTRVSIEQLNKQIQNMEWSKFIAAGHAVSATVANSDASMRGVALCQFASRGGRITGVQVFI